MAKTIKLIDAESIQLYPQTLTTLVLDTDGSTLDTLLDNKQEVLTFDTEPTADSTNPVTSGGVYSALSNVSVDLSGYYTSAEVDSAISAAIETAIGSVESGSY